MMVMPVNGMVLHLANELGKLTGPQEEVGFDGLLCLRPGFETSPLRV